MNEAYPSSIPQEIEQFFDSAIRGDEAWLWRLLLMAGALLIALVIHVVLFFVIRKVLRKTEWIEDRVVLKGLRLSTLAAFLLLALQLVLPQLGLGDETLKFCKHANSIVLIVSIVWLLLALIRTSERIVVSRYRVDVRDNRLARHMHTQFRIIGRTLSIVIMIIGLSAILITFPMIRQLGTSLLASAGILGLAIGLAARPTIENIVAGLQIAFTKPIALDDVVVIQGEWGRIEEITTTYVVVRIWDQRRLVVPFSWILQQPFQNWTRVTAEVLGTVFLHADYTLPLQPVREELERIAKASEKWDGRVCLLQVTDARTETVELRALVSAADSPSAWDLRCEVREKLIRFIQREYPECLPRVRAELQDRSRDLAVVRPSCED